MITDYFFQMRQSHFISKIELFFYNWIGFKSQKEKD